MAAMSDARADEPRLTLDQGYVAAYEFIRQFYERDSHKPESMWNLLQWMQLEGTRLSADPDQWHDWATSVSKALDSGQEAVMSQPLSPPGTK
jgi:hypothetical protein